MTAIKGISAVNLTLSNAMMATIGIKRKACHAYAQPLSAKPNPKKIAVEITTTDAINIAFCLYLPSSWLSHKI